MKALIIALSVILGSLVAMAEQAKDEEPPAETPNIEIRRFVYINNFESRSPTAEMCGRVTETHLNDRIIITTDKGRRAESRYTTTADDEGIWCVIVKTVTGRGEARVWRVGHGTYGNATALANNQE